MRYQDSTDDQGEAMSSVFVRHEKVVLVCEGPSLTRQEFAEDCDINVLMARYEKTGVISHVNQRQPLYLDMSAVPDYHTALLQLQAAEAAFMSLPASVRREFDNDPAKFVAFAEDPENVSQMRTWGLAEPEKAPEAPMKVEVVSAPVAAPPSPEPPQA